MNEEERAEDIDAVGRFEVGDGYGREGRVEGDAGVVDEDVDLEFAVRGREVLAGERNELGWAGGRAEVGLDGDRADVVGGGEVVCDGGGEVGGGGRSVVDDQVAALGGEVLGDGRADAWGSQLL